MSFIKTIIITQIILGFSINIYAQEEILKDYKLLVTLENAPFDTLYLFDYTNNRNISIPGKKKGHFTWEITIPDSIVNSSENMSLKVIEYDSISNSTTQINFCSTLNGKVRTIANIGIEDRLNFIHARYKKTNILSDYSFLTKIDKKDSVIVGNLICRDFELDNPNENLDIMVRIDEPFFSWFMNLEDQKRTYADFLEHYNTLVQKYPASRYLISNLANNLNKYKSLEDIRNMYAMLSDKHKKTVWGKMIESFMAGKFENSSLPTLDKMGSENVIQDMEKYNLIVFTASWCAPCLKEIPILKEINEDLNKDLIITYISIDEQNTVSEFQKVISEHNIPWRSLLAYKETKEIKYRYFVEGIPHCILVYPNGNMEKIEVRDKEKRVALYKMINQSKLRNSDL